MSRVDYPSELATSLGVEPRVSVPVALGPDSTLNGSVEAVGKIPGLSVPWEN